MAEAEPRQTERLNRAKDIVTIATSLVAIAVAIVGGVNWLVGLQLDAKIAPLQADVETLQTNVETLQTNVGVIQANVETLQTDVETLQTGFRNLNDTIGSLAARVLTVDHLDKVKKEIQDARDHASEQGPQSQWESQSGARLMLSSFKLKCQPVPGSSDGSMDCTVQH